MFRVGEKVVYPNHGVSVVERIAVSAPDGGEKQTYYHLRLLANDSKVMVPEENLDRVGLRRLAKEREIKDLLALIEDGNIDVYKDWKGRYKQNLDKMRTGELTDARRGPQESPSGEPEEEPLVPRKEDVREGQVLHRE